MSYYDNALKKRLAMDKAGAMLTDAQALTVPGIYRAWESYIGAEIAANVRITYGGELWRTVQAHTVQAIYPPGVDTASLYTRIDETHAGTLDDPIPYSGNMELLEGMYYTQDNAIYLCTRSTGQPVYHALSELVGIYVEVIS